MNGGKSERKVKDCISKAYTYDTYSKFIYKIYRNSLAETYTMKLEDNLAYKLGSIQTIIVS